MLTREQLKFILTVTDYFHGHWEDPEWGKRINQALAKVNVYITANDIEDKDVRAAVQGVIEKDLAKSVAVLRTIQDPLPRGPRG